MTSLMLTSFLVLLMLFFGAMAFYPLFVGGTDTDLDTQSLGEDRVISIVPASPDPKRPTRIRVVEPAPQDDAELHPWDRPAA